jgi:ribosomal protein S3
MVEALASANPLEQHLKQREMLERGLQDHLQHARIHQDYLDALSSANPLAQHLKQREMFERSLQDHLKHTHIQ